VKAEFILIGGHVVLVYIASWIVSTGFEVHGFFADPLFSIAFSVTNSILDAMAGD
jgi:uncharacterized membrane protein YvlD (DUF360 family)